MLRAVVQDPPVDLVGEDPQVLPDRDIGDSFDVRSRQDATGRVRRRVDDQQPGPRGDEAGEFVHVETKVIRHPDRHGDRSRAHEARQRLVDRVPGVRDEHLVAGIDETEDAVQHHSLATDRHEHLRRVGGDALPRGDIDGDRFAQGRDAWERRVVGLALVERALGRFAGRGSACRNRARRSGDG